MSLLSNYRKDIISAIHRFDSDDHTLDGFLEDILTPQEIESIAERIELMRQLTSGKTQREIAHDMSISITTVTRGSRVLQYGRL